MTELRTAKEALEGCAKKGLILPLAEIDLDKITTLAELAQGDQEAGEKLEKGLEPRSILWNNVFCAHYDSLHKLADAFLRFDAFTFTNHLCLFAYLCAHHPELELDWSFFEKIRTKRNGIQYYGQKASKEDWLTIKPQIHVYITTLKNAIKQKIEKEVFV